MSRLQLLLLTAWLPMLCLTAQERTLTGGEYWIDSGSQGHIPVSIGDDGLMQFTVDGSSLAEGMHTLNCRAQDSEGMWSPLQTWAFYRARLSTQEATKVSSYEYWTDDRTDIDSQGYGTVDGAEVQFSVDASRLSEGLHTLHYRLTDDQGRKSPMQSWLFYRAAPAYESGARTLEYWIDEGAHQSEDVTESLLAFSVDASSLGEGLHTLHYRLCEAGGRKSPVQSCLFYRNVRQPQRISWYRYWWNNHQDKAVTVDVTGDVQEFVFTQRVAVPDYAKTDGFSTERVARFHIIFGDDMGHTSALQWADVTYPESTLLLGDANGDGRVNITDVAAVINRINGLSSATFMEQQADANMDGKINIADVSTIINIINQK